MEPGPELDRLVAERVMGWSDAQDASQYYPGDGVWRSPDGHPLHAKKWSPSTDIEAAMEVVNKLLSRYNFSIYSGRYPIRWFVQIVAVEDWETKALVEDENLPLAICRAALSALMEASDE